MEECLKKDEKAVQVKEMSSSLMQVHWFHWDQDQTSLVFTRFYTQTKRAFSAERKAETLFLTLLGHK